MTLLVVGDDSAELRRLGLQLLNHCPRMFREVRTVTGWENLLLYTRIPRAVLVAQLRVTSPDSVPRSPDDTWVGGTPPVTGLAATVFRMSRHFRRVPCVGLGQGTLAEKIGVIDAGGYSSVSREASATEIWEVMQLAMARAKANMRRVDKIFDRRNVRLQDMLSTSPAVVSEDHYGLPPLKDRRHSDFQGLVDRYVSIIHASMEMRIVKVDHDLSGRLADLAGDLAISLASGRDIMDIHRTATEQLSIASRSSAKRKALADESRLMLVGLLGKLLANYRTTAVQTSNG